MTGMTDDAVAVAHLAIRRRADREALWGMPLSEVDIEAMAEEVVAALAAARPSPPTAVEVVQMDPGLPLPSYARAGDAGADLVARSDVTVAAGGGRALVPTGIRLALPDGYAGFVQPRSGLALRHGVTVLNSPGLIDAGYRDELGVILVNHDPRTDYEVRRGDRVAQLVVQRVADLRFLPVEDLPASDRGRGGFGHSGR
jgi:dUTP pyrophosphatase